MLKTFRDLAVVLLIALFLFPEIARSIEMTLPTGGGQPFTNQQPSLGINHVIRISGTFDELGEVGMFAGNFAPDGWAFPEGQFLSISSHPALFDKIGITFGGNGIDNFALPNLRGRTLIGQRAGPGLTPRSVGDVVGTNTTTLTVDHLPSHNHALRQGNHTGFTGGGQAIANWQPSLALTPIIAATGTFPSRNLVAPGTAGNSANSNDLQPIGVGPDNLLVEVSWIAGNQIPDGWFPAFGDLLPISQHTAMFSLMGTFYGGDGRSTFGLPDLRARTAIGVGTGPGLSPRAIGGRYGIEEITASVSQLPSHFHNTPEHGPTFHTGGSTSIDNMQPSLGLNYIIALQGIDPSSSLQVQTDGAVDGENAAHEPSLPHALGSGSEPFLGSVSLFAGNFAPRGYALAEGQLLDISQHEALFSLLGTTYGGDGRTTFGLPDLRGRAAVHPDNSGIAAGFKYGAQSVTLSSSQIPSHTHTFEAFQFGDFDRDDDVDGNDFLEWQRGFGAIYDSTDLNNWEANFGTNPSALSLAHAVPEPTTASLLALVLATTIATYRRRPSSSY